MQGWALGVPLLKEMHFAISVQLWTSEILEKWQSDVYGMRRSSVVRDAHRTMCVVAVCACLHPDKTIYCGGLCPTLLQLLVCSSLVETRVKH